MSDHIRASAIRKQFHSCLVKILIIFQAFYLLISRLTNYANNNGNFTSSLYEQILIHSHLKFSRYKCLNQHCFKLKFFTQFSDAVQQTFSFTLVFLLLISYLKTFESSIKTLNCDNLGANAI